MHYHLISVVVGRLYLLIFVTVQMSLFWNFSQAPYLHPQLLLLQKQLVVLPLNLHYLFYLFGPHLYVMQLRSGDDPGLQDTLKNASY